MSKQTRVHLLAKELGVKSKAIVDKCQAEGLDIKNHMSTISAGLAATIREWFSEGEHTTTVEKAKRVDLKKVRVKKKKKAKEKEAEEKTKTEEPKAPAPPEEVAVAEAALAPEQAPAAETVPEKTETAEAPVAAEEPTKKPKKTKKKTKDKTKELDEKIKPTGPVIVRKEPPKTEPVTPAGPMLEKPKAAKLNGPRVIRVEKVEDDVRTRGRQSRPPKAKPKAKPRYDAPMAETLMEAAGGPIQIGDEKKGKGRKGKYKKDKADDDGFKGSSRRVHARDMEERRARLAAARGESLRARPSRKIESKKSSSAEQTPVQRPEKAYVTEPILVKDLSAALALKASDIITKLMSQGVMATANQAIATDMAELIALDFGTELIVERKQSPLEVIQERFDKREHKKLIKRPPVVTMLGHVDHGKTSLLDQIRKTSVAEGEAGGITQHIGAYQVELNGKKVTFLDTPGHEAFTAMRARGANMTDIVVLVVAADDGLMPQTIEAINHAKAANVEIIVALNKIDLPGVDINRIYGQLAEQDMIPSEWGGNTEIVKTSAMTGQGIEDLIEHLDYIADLKEYKADPNCPATGWVIEAKMTTSHGAVATILLKEGKLEKGDTVLAGCGWGRVRTLKNSKSKSVKKASSSDPIEISGLSDVPQAGDRFFVLNDVNEAKSASDALKMQNREESLAQRAQISLDNLFSQIEAGNVKELNIILRGDVQGSIDVLVKYLTELSTDEVKIKILQAAVGGITEGDVLLAEASGAIIIGFNVVPDDRAKQIAEQHGIDIRLYNVIYKITEDLKDAMSGLLEPELKEEVLGSVVVRNTFKVSSVGTIAGCFVKSGIVSNKAKLRIIRNNIVVRDNCMIASLKHFKDDVREVKAGLECGIKIAGFDDIKIDDIFEAYKVIEVARTID